MDYFTSFLFNMRTEITEEVHYTHSYWIFLLPLVMIASDIVSGWIQATINSTWDSTKMRKGLYRKTLEILAVGVLWIFGIAFGIPALPIGASLYVVLMESVSVLENLDLAGIPVPIWIVKRLKKTMQSMIEGDEQNE